jgi:hypothetical protein
MAQIQDLSTMQLAFKAQTGLDAPAALIKRNKMRKRPRHGMKGVTAAYETEVSVGPCDPIFEAVLGCNATPAVTYTNADWGGVTITGGGITATFATGTLITDGVRAGMFLRFAALSVAGNNGIWVPIIAVTEGVATFAPGYILDNAVDAAYSVDVAKSFSTPAQYIGRYFSVEEFLDEALVSKYGTDMRFHGLTISIDPKAYTRIAVTLTGRDMRRLTATTVPIAPAFPAPTFIDAESLILLDGGIYVNGVKRTDLTSLRFGLAANIGTTDVIGSRLSPDITVGQFAFTGDFTGVVSDGADFATFDAEDNISVLLHCKEKDTQKFVGFYIGYASFGGYSTPMGGEGMLVQTIPLFGGEDERGVGFAPTTVLISTSD